MGLQANNKRTISRAKRRIMVRYGQSAAEKTAFTKNLSETGMFLHTNQVFKPGSTIHIQIQFPKHTIAMWARVMWAKTVPIQLAHVLECGMGLHFEDPPADWTAFYHDWAKKAGVLENE